MRLQLLVRTEEQNKFSLWPEREKPFQPSIDYRKHSLVVVIGFSGPASKNACEIWHLDRLPLEGSQQAHRCAFHLALIDTHLDGR